MKSYLDMWEKAFDFKGRTSKNDFWTAYGINVGILILFYALLSITTAGGDEMTAIGILPTILACIYSFMMIIPMLSLQIRRFHDTGHSAGFYVLCLFLSLLSIGVIIRFIFYLKDGDSGRNNWGAGIDGEPERTYTLWKNADENTDSSLSYGEEEKFVDQYITESELPKKKRWFRNMLILFGIAAAVLFLIVLAAIFI